MPQAQFDAIVLTNAPEDSAPLTFDVALERDDVRVGTVLDPDGKPLAGAVVDGLDEMERDPTGPLRGAEFRVIGVVAGRSRRLTFTHPAKGLSGSLLLRGDEPGPFVAQLKPSATLSGRLVDDRGKPRPGVWVMGKDWEAHADDPAYAFIPNRKTGDDGRFRFDGLVAGLKYEAMLVNVEDDKGFGVVFEDLTLAPGESRDLGDVRAKPRP